jgi:hypothetical protein
VLFRSLACDRPGAKFSLSSFRSNTGEPLLAGLRCRAYPANPPYLMRPAP